MDNEEAQINNKLNGERPSKLNEHLPIPDDEEMVSIGKEGKSEDEFSNGYRYAGKDDVSYSIDLSGNSSSAELGDHPAAAAAVMHLKSPDDLIHSSAASLELSEIPIEKREESEAEHGGSSSDSDSREQQPVSGEVHNDRAEVSKINGDISVMICPHSQLPKPEAPPGINSPPMERSQSLPENGEMPAAIGKFFREKSQSWSSAITRRLSSIKDNKNNQNHIAIAAESESNPNVTEFTLSGLKVIVKLKKAGDADADADANDQLLPLKGVISFFSRSNCRDCTAVRSFLREKKLRYVEINIDVFPTRENELIERTGGSTVPQIFFNEKLIGGLVVLNSLRNSGLLEQRMREILSKKCPDDAPEAPVYGFDDPEEEQEDELLGFVRVLRLRLPIQDRLLRMKIIKNCFSGAELVEVLIHHLDCGRTKAVEMGKQLARKHFIHHVLGENEFEDGNHFYRFLEHEPFILRCFNFRGSANDNEPRPAAIISKRLTKIMSAVLESYASDDRLHLDYINISNSEEFRRYINLVQDLQRVNVSELSEDEKLTFFLNLYNAMVIHAVIRIGHPGSTVIDRRSFNSDFMYLVGGHPYSLTAIKNGILRGNRRAPYSLAKPFGSRDKRIELAFTKVNPLIHFGLFNGTKSSPAVKFFTPCGVESELRHATREFFKRNSVEVDLAKRTVYLTRIIKWFHVDFGSDREILKWIINYLDATKSGLLTHLLSDGGPVNIVYQNFDWSVNSYDFSLDSVLLP